MYGVASVAPLTSPYRTVAAYRASAPGGSVKSVRAVKARGNVGSSAGSATVQNAPLTAMQSNLPLGLLLSVKSPSGNNLSANADYADLQSALRVGNLASAQQAYLRLQSDLLLANSAPAASGSAAATTGAGLNAAA